MGNDPTPAWTAWSSLPERTQLEVGHLARLGVRHPNPEAADAAGAWASVLLSTAEHERAEAWWTGLVVATESVFQVDPAFVSEIADRRAWRRWAEQVLAANAGAHPYRVASAPAPQPRRWSDDQRRRQRAVLMPVMLCLVGVLVFLAVLVTRT